MSENWIFNRFWFSFDQLLMVLMFSVRGFSIYFSVCQFLGYFASKIQSGKWQLINYFSVSVCVLFCIPKSVRKMTWKCHRLGFVSIRLRVRLVSLKWHDDFGKLESYWCVCCRCQKTDWKMSCKWQEMFKFVGQRRSR